jgi:hypothetical protein
MFGLNVLFVIAACAAATVEAQSGTLPTVDLGYAVQQATLNVSNSFHNIISSHFNDWESFWSFVSPSYFCLSSFRLHRFLSAQEANPWLFLQDTGIPYYNFSNIRYAAPPVGNLRFAQPVKPAVNRTLNDGQQSVICSQASPGNPTTATYHFSGANLSSLGINWVRFLDWHASFGPN